MLIHTQDYQPGRGVSRTSCIADVGRVFPHVVFLHLQDLHTVNVSLCLQQKPFGGSQRVAIFEPVYSGFGEAWKTSISETTLLSHRKCYFLRQLQ